MNKDSLSFLVCPNCRTGNLSLETYIDQKHRVEEGRIICTACGIWYRIEQGLVDMLPLNMRKMNLHKVFANKYHIPLDAKQQEARVDDKTKQMKFFEESADDYEKRVTNSCYYKALHEVTFLDWMQKNLVSKQRVLDIGCGTGRECISLAEHDIQTIGIDISEKMLQLAWRKAKAQGLGEKVDFIVADGENPPVRDNCFDACIFYSALHHISDKQKAILNASRKIIKNGKFYALDPHDSPLRLIFDLMMKIWKLYDEEASDNYLLKESQMKEWLLNANIQATIKLSTYFPPHVFYGLNSRLSIRLLKTSDSFFSKVPWIKKCAGVIITEGVKIQ